MKKLLRNSSSVTKVSGPLLPWWIPWWFRRFTPAETTHCHIQHHDVTGGDESKGIREIISRFVQPFDLTLPPLLRVALIKSREAQYVLALDMHHSITDGSSHAVLVTDLMALYQGKDLTRLPLQYKNFSEWQNSPEQKDDIKQQEIFWLDTFREEPLS